MHVFSSKIISLAAIAGASILVVGTFFFYAYAAPLSSQPNAGGVVSMSPGRVYLSEKEAERVSSMPEVGPTPMREVHIANNGLVLLRGAEVISTSGSTMRVGLAWEGNNFNWKIKTNGQTKFFTATGEKGTAGDIQTGDIVSVSGMLASSGGESVIIAEFLRE